MKIVDRASSRRFVWPRAVLLSVVPLFSMVSSSAALSTLQSSTVTPEVCVVAAGVTDCGSAAVAVEPSVDGVVGARVAVRVDLRGVLPADAQVAAAQLELRRVGGGESEPLLRWGESPSAEAVSAATFADDPYFASGATGTDEPPAGVTDVMQASDLGGWQWPLGEPLDRARSLSSAPTAFYLDLAAGQDAVTFAGPAFGDESARPVLRVIWQRGTGIRGNYSFTTAAEGSQHRLLVNDATGNLLVDAPEVEDARVGRVSRYLNSLEGTAWTSELEARLERRAAWGATQFRGPSGETVSVDDPYYGWRSSAGDDAVAQPSGQQFTDAGTHAFDNRWLGIDVDVDEDALRHQYAFLGERYATNLFAEQPTAIYRRSSGGIEDAATPGGATGYMVRWTAGSSTVGITSGPDPLIERQILNDRRTLWRDVTTSPKTTLADIRRDETGQIVRHISRAGTAAYVYTDGQLSRIVDADGQVFSPAFDGDGRLVRLTVQAADGHKTWMERSYPETVDPRCAEAPETERSVIGTSSAGGEAVWCVAGSGSVVDFLDFPANLPRIAPNRCDDNCPDPDGEEPAPTPESAASEAELAPDDTEEPAGDAGAGEDAAPYSALAEASATCGAGAPEPGFQSVFGLGDDRDPNRNSPSQDPAQDKRGRVWGSRGFDCLRPKWMRRIVPWNIEFMPSIGQQYRIDHLNQWLAEVAAAGAEPVLAFDQCYGGDGVSGDGDPVTRFHGTEPGDIPEGQQLPKHDCALPPSVEDYRYAVRRFIRNYPQVKYIAAFNEPNHPKQKMIPTGDPLAPTTGVKADYLNVPGTEDALPVRVGMYFRVLAEECRARPGTPCVPIAGELSDLDHNATKPGRSLTPYLRDLVAGMGDEAAGATWALHYYAALADRGREKGRCRKADMSSKITNYSSAALRCWGRISQLIRGLDVAIKGPDGPSTFWLSEGGVDYGSAKRWKKGCQQRKPQQPCTGLGYRGPQPPTEGNPDFIAPPQRAEVRNTAMYDATFGLMQERTSIAARWDVRLPRVFAYHWRLEAAFETSSEAEWDSGLFGNRDTSNALFENARPAFVALCEYSRRKPDGSVPNRRDCWAVDPGTQSGDPGAN